MPLMLLTASVGCPAFGASSDHLRDTASPKSKPSTASVKSLMKLVRRNSPSVKRSKPISLCLWRIFRMRRSSRASSSVRDF